MRERFSQSVGGGVAFTAELSGESGLLGRLLAAWALRAEVRVDFRHTGSTRTEPEGIDAGFMLLERDAV